MKSAVAIVVSGGPAPGINSVIASIVIECENHDTAVYGVQGGFAGLLSEKEKSLHQLTISEISRIHSTGGSHLGTSRCNPCQSADNIATLKATLATKGISSLIIIGGEGSLYVSQQIANECSTINVVHVPKTIDNDIPLPHNAPTFGYESARQEGAKIIDTLLVDAKTTRRWYLVNCMGRTSGALTLGVGLSGSATLSLIPEECSRGAETIETVARRIFPTVAHRTSEKKPYGVIMLAEGLIDTLSADEPLLRNAPRDHIGRIHLSEIHLVEAIAPVLREFATKASIDLTASTKDIGYELRCCAPCPFDIEYTRCLGYGAARLALTGEKNKLITYANGKLTSLPLAALNDSKGRVPPRIVDLNSDLYRVARHHMVIPTHSSVPT